MSISKERLTVTVEPHLVQAGNEAVAEGRVGSLSAWVNLALAERAAKERRLRALADVIAAYEQEVGVMTAEELQAQERADRASARVVRGAGPRRAKARRRRAAPSASYSTLAPSLPWTRATVPCGAV